MVDMGTLLMKEFIVESSIYELANDHEINASETSPRL